MPSSLSLLIEQHRHCDRDLDRCEAALQPRSDWSLARSAYASFDRLTRQHFDIEEQALFPAIDAALGVRDSGPTAVMRQEHEQIRQMLDACAERLQAGDAVGALAEIDTLRVLIQQHNLKEENVLYPLGEQHVDGLGERIHAALALQAGAATGGCHCAGTGVGV